MGVAATHFSVLCAALNMRVVWTPIPSNQQNIVRWSHLIVEAQNGTNRRSAVVNNQQQEQASWRRRKRVPRNGLVAEVAVVLAFLLPLLALLLLLRL